MTDRDIRRLAWIIWNAGDPSLTRNREGVNALKAALRAEYERGKEEAKGKERNHHEQMER